MRHVSAARRTLLAALMTAALSAGALFAFAPAASADLSQCPGNAVCAWSGTNYTGQFSWWPASSTGCHGHADNPTLRSFWNRTGYTVRLGGQGNLGSGLADANRTVTGDICWPA
jgi:Peptidase inhibitor family I36